MNRFQTSDYQEQLGLSSRTIVDWKNYYRDICGQYFEKNPIQIGGPGKIVEIDETYLLKRKFNRGRLVTHEQWVFGGVERGTKNSFVVAVDKRNRDTLFPLIHKYIAPGSIIISDQWAAYRGLEFEGYTHLTVNHSENFVDPVTGAHTQTIESLWQKLKQKHKQRYGTHRSVLDSYLAEFMWHQIFGDGPVAFHHLLDQIRDFYPV